jgi:serine/threonine-protein kinase
VSSQQQAIAHYRIISKLGQGGMGAVYRATDTKLGRDVAIKVLPESFASNPDRLVRFTREAQVLASLNHPNIAAIYGVEDRALIMELVEGPTLAERIAQGPMSWDEVLPVAKQIAEALEYAHERGVVHRDLKPANVKVTPEGRVKVLDFGLAKALTNDSVASDPADSPTLTMQTTLAGVILGTAAYMSPEQAKGKPVDKRADIWAFGVVLVEMLTGRRMYGGETAYETLAAVMMKEPDLSALPASTPAAVKKLARRCLERDPRKRLRDIGEARIALEEAPEEAPAPVPVVTARQSRRPWVAVGIALAIAAGASGIAWRTTRPLERPLTRLSVDLGPEAIPGLGLSVAISPDGQRLAYSARGANGQQVLATRLLDQAQPVLLPGTENAYGPFFSPDGQWIGFFVPSPNQLRKISVRGGAPVTLCNTAALATGSWGEDGNILVAPAQTSSGLSRVSSAGGALQPLTKPAGGVTHWWPQILPQGEAVLFTAYLGSGSNDNSNLEVLVLKTGEVKTIVRGGYYGRYLPSGHLVYIHEETLFAAPFDASRLDLRGPAVPVQEDVWGISASPGAGTLVYLSAKAYGWAEWTIVWLDASGRTQPLLAKPGYYQTARLSPDGERLAVVSGDDIYVFDPRRDTMTRLTLGGGSNAGPIWTPDGKHIVYHNDTLGLTRVMWIRADGAGTPVELLQQKGDRRSLLVPNSFTPEGRRLAYSAWEPETNDDLWTLPIDTSDPDHPKPGKPELFPAYAIRGGEPDLFARRPLAGVSIERSGARRDLREAGPSGRPAAGGRQVADLDRRRPVAPLVAWRTRVVLHQPGQPHHEGGLLGQG